MATKHRASRRQPATVEPRPAKAARGWIKPLALAGVVAVAIGVTYVAVVQIYWAKTPPGMVWIPGGDFLMGSDGDAQPRNEQPVHRVRIDGFFLDETEVTNAQFRAFVAATGYATTAEFKPDWEEMKRQLPPGTPKPPEDQLVPGSMVFTPPVGPVPLSNVAAWWRWVPGANWKHPEGPASTLDGREDHPVVQVTWDDANAYAKWAGKRLPTEAEWEYAARGGLVGKRFTWGDEPPSDADGRKANIWQGTFPYANKKVDGFDRTAPVKSYPPNGYGLYDMAGNAWEWCADWYRADAYVGRSGLTVNPKGPDSFWDPNEPLVPKRVIRGGSFLCHASYCESYRPAARRGTAIDSSTSHIGFRCAKDGPIE